MPETTLESVNNYLTKSFGLTIFRAVLILMVGAQLYLSTRYVTREEHEVLKADVSEIKIALRLMASQAAQLQDHETRIRFLERSVFTK